MWIVDKIHKTIAILFIEIDVPMPTRRGAHSPNVLMTIFII